MENSCWSGRIILLKPICWTEDNFIKHFLIYFDSEKLRHRFSLCYGETEETKWWVHSAQVTQRWWVHSGRASEGCTHVLCSWREVVMVSFAMCLHLILLKILSTQVILQYFKVNSSVLCWGSLVEHIPNAHDQLHLMGCLAVGDMMALGWTMHYQRNQ